MSDRVEPLPYDRVTSTTVTAGRLQTVRPSWVFDPSSVTAADTAGGADHRPNAD